MPIPFGPSSQEFTNWLFYRELENDKNGPKNGAVHAQNIDAVSYTYLLELVGVGQRACLNRLFGLSYTTSFIDYRRFKTM
ncbi:hypothetical protein BN77_p10649 [Rhizobium mesoamericanum STM3625]|uniref:Uncharacterized protein n=1 Tax=Rhizobium mesoamericanum STM3625 TaxID=1211777 RepID=K0Q4D4_9HYPH|nr:hypothetical protein BN77_p10649 [Rhizobium mesoamericanum STM3625]